MCCFFILKWVINMKIYLDLVLILNFIFDFILLVSVSVLLKRNVSLNKIILSAFIGSLSILTLFLNINSIQLFLIKIFISIIMVLIAFNYRDLKYTLKNLFFLYTVSMVLGGVLYFLNIEFSYKQVGLVFYHNGLSINVIVLIILSPIILYFYIKQLKELKNNYNNYYKVKIKMDKHIINCNGFLDTGNKLEDPYFHKPILIIDKRKIVFDINEFEMILVPFMTVSGSSMMSCYKVDYVDIDSVGIKKNCLLGIMDDKIKIDGIDIILNTKLWEE